MKQVFGNCRGLFSLFFDPLPRGNLVHRLAAACYGSLLKGRAPLRGRVSLGLSRPLGLGPCGPPASPEAAAGRGRAFAELAGGGGGLTRPEDGLDGRDVERVDLDAVALGRAEDITDLDAL